MFTVIRLHSSLNCRKLSKNLLSSAIVCSTRGCRTKPRQRLGSYFLTKYMEFMKSYEMAMESKFPAAVKMYRVFSVGIKEFKTDLVLYFQVFKKVGRLGKSSLTRRELEVFHQMPKDMIKLAPVLLISAIPFGGVIFGVAAMFPRVLLSSHFWSLQQRFEFAMLLHKKKLVHYRPVFRSLQGQLRSVKNDPLHKPWSKVLGMLGSGIHPSSKEIVECKTLFEGEPYHISKLNTMHVSHLLRVHRLHRGWRRRARLRERGFLLLRLDRAMIREGGPNSLTQDELRWACFFRGLNPVNISHADAVRWLDAWLEVSSEVDENSLSLLLHTPILLGYNEPSNWLLLHDTRNI